MLLLYEQYLHHFNTGRHALAAGRREEARRHLLLASRCLLQLAGQTRDDQAQQMHKARGLKLLEMARKIPAETGRPGGEPMPQLDEGGEPAEPSRWEITEKPGIYFKDIAGLSDVKDLIRRRVIYPFQNPELAARYGRTPGGGLLLYGPPGTGKTMMAKAVATELDARFFNVLCSDIMSKWVGEAEQNVRDLFAAARAAAPAVVFLDETEALVPRRGGNSSVMNRVIPEFLSQLDGLRGNASGLLTLGATNRPWDLDPAAMRPGRFGEHVYVPLPDQAARRFILETTLGQMPLADDVDLEQLAERTEGFSGADLHGLVDRIVDPAFEAAIQAASPVAICGQHVTRALALSRPSVSRHELARYHRFRDGDEAESPC